MFLLFILFSIVAFVTFLLFIIFVFFGSNDNPSGCWLDFEQTRNEIISYLNNNYELIEKYPYKALKINDNKLQAKSSSDVFVKGYNDITDFKVFIKGYNDTTDIKVSIYDDSMFFRCVGGSRRQVSGCDKFEITYNLGLCFLMNNTIPAGTFEGFKHGLKLKKTKPGVFDYKDGNEFELEETKPGVFDYKVGNGNERGNIKIYIKSIRDNWYYYEYQFYDW